MTRLLIVEDDPYVQRMYRRMFSFQNFLVTTASDGVSGLECINNDKPDLVLLDIMLPDMNGLEVLAKIKNNPNTKEIPVLMLTNVGDEKIMEEAKKLGADCYMIKSDFSPDQVIDKINQYVKNFENAKKDKDDKVVDEIGN